MGPGVGRGEGGECVRVAARKTKAVCMGAAVRGVADGETGLVLLPALTWAALPAKNCLARANDLLLTSRVFFSEEAEQLGIVNRVVPAADLLAETKAYARQMVATVSPGALRETKRQVYTDLHRDLASAVVESEALVSSMMQQPDYAEGVAAFLEKRPPHWSGQ